MTSRGARRRGRPPASRRGRPGLTAAVWLIAAALHLGYWVSLRTGWLSPLSVDTAHLFGPGCDFFALYQAGHAALRGESLYTYVQGRTAIPYGYPFRYLPVAAYFPGIPFTLLPPAASYAVWIGITEIALLYAVSETNRRCGGGLRGALLGLLWLGFWPLFVHMWLGQFTLALALMLFWAVLRYEDGKLRSAMCWWIGSVLWKPASLLWLPLWLRERRYWGGVVLAALLVAANGLHFLVFPADYKVFAEANLKSLSLWVASNIGLSALVYQFTGDGPVNGPLRALLTGACLAPALWVTFRPVLAPSKAAPFWLLAAVWTTLFFLIYKEVWEQHLVLLLPFLVLGLWRAPSRRLAVLTLLLALPSPSVFYDVRGLGLGVDPQPYWSTPVSILHHAWRVVPLVALYVHWLAECWPPALERTFLRVPPMSAEAPGAPTGHPEPSTGHPEPSTCHPERSEGSRLRTVGVLAAALLLASGWMAWSRWGPVRERPVPPGARVRQWNQIACGPAAVATLLNTYGVAWTRSGLEQECRVTSVGASLYGLREGLRRRGFTAEGLRARSPQALCRVPRPFIAYLPAAGGAGTGHFMVAERLRGGSFDLFDPTSGEVRRWTAQRLHERGQGWALAVSPRK